MQLKKPSFLSTICLNSSKRITLITFAHTQILNLILKSKKLKYYFNRHLIQFVFRHDLNPFKLKLNSQTKNYKKCFLLSELKITSIYV